MGLFSSTTKSTVPDWLKGPMQGVVGDATRLGNMDPRTFVPDANSLQVQAGQGAAGLNSTPWNFDGALDLARGVGNAAAPRINAQSLLPDLDKYFNPYEQRVIDTSLADFDFDAGKTKAQLDLNLAGTPFQGSGAALEKSFTTEGLARARGSLDSNLRSQGFNTAAGLSDAEAQRRQQAASLNAGLMAQGQQRSLDAARTIADIASLFGGNQRADISTQLDAGGTLRDVDTQVAQAPLNLAQFESGIYGDLAPLFQQTKQSGGLFGQILGGLGAAAMGAGGLGFSPFGKAK